MRCSTLPGTEPTCTGTATHMLLYTEPDTQAEVRDPICKPCGDGFVSRPRLKGRIVPLHVHMPERAFIEIVEGHRLVKDEEHEARCFDCGTTGTPTWFRFRTNGCPGRPESITVLRHSRDTAGWDMPEVSARLWWDYAVDYLRMHVEDWRTVTDHAEYSAYFTFRDREYGVRYLLLDHRFGAVKLPNRGRPAPERINPEDNYEQVVFRFYGLANKYESTYFATYTPGREHVVLYYPEGQIRAVLRITGLDFTESTHLTQVTGAVCDAFGAVAEIKFNDFIYE